MAYTASQGAVISVSVDGAAASQRQIEGIAQSMNSLSATVQGAMRNLAAGVGIGGGLVQVVQMSDAYTKVTSQLRLATDSTHAYAAAYADVKRIAAEAQADLGSTGMLYARIAKGTNELGIGQKRVADITEVVNLALKVSAATAEEAASANLQLSQAFASGTLRGEEFNAVNEAAPRLMQALADGMGVPIGALKQMASDGLITSQVMADVLPKSLGHLREEANQVQTVSGAFQVLKNNVLEFTATNAQANGSVAVVTGGINLLANNLVALVGTLTTITAVKTVNWLTTWTTETYKKIAADQASRTASVAAAQADLARIEATGAQAAVTQAAIVIGREEAVARMAQANTNIIAAKAAIEAATAAGVQSFALRTLRIATAELAEAEAVRGAALAELAVLGQQAARVSTQLAAAQTAQAAAARGVAAAQAAAGIGTGLASRALGLLGGPIGAVVTVLGVAATAWSWYQSKQQEANASAVQETEASTIEIIEQLNKQTAKLRERLELQKQLGVSPQETSPAADRAAAVLAEINDLTSKHTELTIAEQAQLYALGLEYNNLTVALQQNKVAKAETDATGKAAKDLVAVRERLTGVNKQYLEDLQVMQTALEKGAIGQAEYVELVKKLAVETYKSSDAGKEASSAANKEKEAYASLISSIREKIDTNRLELAAGENATESQKAQIKLDQDLAAGKLKLSAAHLARARAAIADLAVAEQAVKQRDAERDVTKYILASTQARDAAAASLQVEYALYGQSADARELAMIRVRAEVDQEKKLAELREAKKPITDQMIAQLNAETKARILVEQATLAQSKALGYAAQLAEENKRFGLEYIADDRARAAATLELDTEVWRKRIALAGEGTDAQKLLQQEFDAWYRNQLLKPELDAQKKIWESVESTAHDTFVSIFDSGKNAFDRLRDTLKNGLMDLLYQMTVKKWIIGVQADMTGGILASAAASAGGASTAGAAGSLGTLGNLASAGKSIYSSITGATGTGILASISSGIGQLGTTLGSNAVQSFAHGLAGYSPTGVGAEALGVNSSWATAGSYAGTAATYGAGLFAGHAVGNMISGGYEIGGHGQAVVNTATVVGALVAGPIGAAIAGAIGGVANRVFGRKAPEITSQGVRGTFDGSGITGETYQNILEKGGWLRSDKRYTNTQALGDGMQSQLKQAFVAIEDASSGLAKSLGLGADALEGYTKTFDIAFTSDAAKNQEAIAAFFGGVADEVAGKLVPNLASFSQSGETASATLQRLAGEFDATTAAVQNIGKTAAQAFGDVGIASAAARERLVQLAGGASALTSLSSSYAQNFLTEAQRLAPVSKALDQQLGQLGLSSIPTTRGEFAKLVSGLDLTNEAQAKQFVSLMQLNEAFALVHPETATKALEDRQKLQDELDQLTMSATDLLAKQRAALDESNRALFDQVQAVKAQAAAVETAKANATALLGGVDSAFSTLQKVVDREKGALQSSIDVHTKSVAKLQSLSQALHSTLEGLRSPEQKLADRSSAQAQIRAAVAIARAGGVLPDADSLKDALSAVTEDASSQFSSYADYLRDLYQTQNDISALGGITDSQLSVEQKSLDALQDQIKRLDDIVANGQAQIDALHGQSVATLSLAEAMGALSSAIGAAKGNPIVGGTSGIASLYQELLGRAPDQAGLQYWQDVLAKGTSLDTIRSSFLASDEYKKLHPFAVGTNYIPEDMPAMVHKGERIIPAADNRLLMSRLASPEGNKEALVAEVRALREEVRQFREMNSVENRAIAKGAQQAGEVLDKWDVTGQPQVRTA